MENQYSNHVIREHRNSEVKTIKSVTLGSVTAVQNKTSYQKCEECPASTDARRSYGDNSESRVHPSIVDMTTPTFLDSDFISICGCLGSDQSSIEDTVTHLSERKRRVYSRLPTTETYLRVHRIPELIRL